MYCKNEVWPYPDLRGSYYMHNYFNVKNEIQPAIFIGINIFHDCVISSSTNSGQSWYSVNELHIAHVLPTLHVFKSLVQHHHFIKSFSRGFFYSSGSTFHYSDCKQQTRDTKEPKGLKDFDIKQFVKRLIHIKEPTMNPLDPELLEAVCMN